MCKRLLESGFDVVKVVDKGGALLRSEIELNPDVDRAPQRQSVLNGLSGGEVKEVFAAVKGVYRPRMLPKWPANPPGEEPQSSCLTLR